MKKLFILMLLMNFATLSFAQTKATNKTAPKKPKIEDVLNQQVEMLNARIDSMTVVHTNIIAANAKYIDSITIAHNNAKAQNTRNEYFKKQFSQIIQKETKLLNSRIEEQKRYVDNIKENVENYEKSSKIHQLIGEAQSVLEKDSNRAIEIYSQVLELDNKNETALLWRGIAYSLLSNSEAALADLNAVIAINPRLARAYNNIGNVYAADERYELAETNYNKALEINPKYDVVYRNIALMYLNQDIHFDKAEYNLNKAISYNKEYIDAYITRAHMYRRMSEIEKNKDTKNKYKELALADMKQANRLKRNNESE